MSGASEAPPDAPEERETQREGPEETRRWPPAPSAGSRREAGGDRPPARQLNGGIGPVGELRNNRKITPIQDVRNCDMELLW
jgi:hypothetical protein